MPTASTRPILGLALPAALLLALAACTANEAPAPQDPAASNDPAPAPPAVPDSNPDNATMERASSPPVRGVVTGKFDPSTPVSESATGGITIEDGRIIGANGTTFETERVALISANDEFTAGQRYADAMMIEPREQVELRQVLEPAKATEAGEATEHAATAPPPAGTPAAKTTAATTPAVADPFCGTGKTRYIALAKVADGDYDVVKLVALSGDALPAASAQGVTLCASTSYQAKR